jgi:chromosome partitioning protein
MAETAEASGSAAGGGARPPVLAVQNMKGGVGKTTVAVNLAALLTERHEKRVLVVDADAQCNASLYLLGPDKLDAMLQGDPKVGTLYDLFHKDVRYIDLTTGERTRTKRTFSSYHQEVRRKGAGSLSLACGSPQLFEVQEIAAEIVVLRIRRWLRALGETFDQVIIDCPPSISSVSLAALRAADRVLIPMAPEIFSAYGLPLLDNTLKQYRKSLRIDAEVAGVVLTRFPKPEDSRFARAGEYRERIRGVCDRLKIPFLEAVISADDAYPVSFENAEPLPFSEDKGLDELVVELQTLALKLELVQERPR